MLFLYSLINWSHGLDLVSWRSFGFSQSLISFDSKIDNQCSNWLDWDGIDQYPNFEFN